MRHVTCHACGAEAPATWAAVSVVEGARVIECARCGARRRWRIRYKRSLSWDDAKRRVAAAALLLVLATVPSTTAAAPEAHVIVRSDAGVAHAAAAVTAAGGHVERSLEIIDSVAGVVPSRRLGHLASAPALDVATDGRLRLLSTGEASGQPSADAGSLATISHLVEADHARAGGLTGAGVDVAIIDSGVARVPGLDAPGAVVDGPDLSFEGGDATARGIDGYGHGTHLAGIIAGRSDVVPGIAPGARLVNVKVADRNGATDVSQVIAAIDWVVQRGRKDGLNVRVISLAFGTDGGADYRSDPLAHAVEVAWRRGVAVVAAAGNHGDVLGRLASPAVDPWVIAVGAAVTQGTPSVLDDEVAAFSSRGDGRRNPDVVAPGISVVSHLAPGSHAARNHGAARVGESLIRGTGTSQAAAVVAAASALLLQSRPQLTPDQLKAALVASARPLPADPATAQGSGLISVAGAARLPLSTVAQAWARSTGEGSIEAARGSLHAYVGGTAIAGERDAWGRDWDGRRWAAASANGSSWSGSSWSGSSWSGSSWSGSSWSGSSWTGSYWG